MTISCSKGEHKETLRLTRNAAFVDNGINITQLNILMEDIECGSNEERDFTVFTLGRICYQKKSEII